MALNKIRQRTFRLLRWTEKWTRTDMIYIVKGGWWLSLAKIVASLSSFALAIAFANLLDKVAYGNYKYVLSIFGLLSIFSLTGILTSAIRSVARGFEGMIRKGIKVMIKWGFLGTLFCVSISIYYLSKGNETLFTALLLSSLFIPFFDSPSIYKSLLGGRKNFKASTICQAIISISATSLTIVALLLTDNIIIILLVYLISYSFLRTIIYLFVVNKLKPNNNLDNETISYGKHLTLINAVNNIMAQIDKILIWHFLGAVNLAIYSFAIAPINQITSFVGQIRQLALPKFSERNLFEVKNTILRKTVLFSLILTAIVLIYIPLAPILYKIIFPQYFDSVIYSQIFSLTIVASAAFLPISALNSQKATKQLYQLNIVIPTIQIILLFTLIYSFGLFGAILARVIGRFINLVASLYLVQKI